MTPQPDPAPAYEGLDSLLEPKPLTPVSVIPAAPEVFEAPVPSTTTFPDFFANETWQLPAKKSALPMLAIAIASAAIAGSVFWGISSLNAAVVPMPVASSQQETLALQTQLNQFVAGQGAKFSIVVKDLKTGAVASSQSDQKFTSASLYKLFVAQGILEKVDRGELSLSRQTKNGLTVESCLKLMITVSDNSCGVALGAMLGWQNYDAALNQQGYSSTTLARTNLQTSASDVALFFSRLYEGSLLSPASNQLLLGLLKSQKVNDRLPTGLPAGTQIAHKTGDLNGLRHDAGVVFGPKTDYLIVVLSGPWRTGNSSQVFGDLSNQVYRQLNP